MRRAAGGGRAAGLRIGAGAGFSGDRIEPAVELAECGELDYLVRSASSAAGTIRTRASIRCSSAAWPRCSGPAPRAAPAS